MTRIELELSHLVTLLQPPYTAGWRNYCWQKALKLAETDEEMKQLPELLKHAMQPKQKNEASNP